MPKIAIDTESISAIMKRLTEASEGIQEYIESVEKSVNLAELEGWNDKKYYEFKESFYDTKYSAMSVISKIEEEQIPFLSKLLSASEELL